MRGGRKRRIGQRKREGKNRMEGKQGEAFKQKKRRGEIGSKEDKDMKKKTTGERKMK